MRYALPITLLAILLAQPVLAPHTARADTKADRARCETLDQKLVLLYQAGKYSEAAQIGEQLIALAKSAFGPENPDYALCLNNLAVLYESMGEYTKAEPLYMEALEIDRKALGDSHPDYALALNNLAALYHSMGEYAKAEPLYKKSMEIRRKALGESHPDYAASLNNLAALYCCMGEYANAEPLYKEAMEIDRKALGEEHLHYAVDLNNLATLYGCMGDYTKSEPAYREAMGIWRKALGEEHAIYATSVNNLRALCHSMGEYAKAEPLLKTAMEIYRKALGDSHPNYAQSLSNLAALHVARGEPEKGLACFNAGLEALHSHTAKTLAALSQERQLGFLQHVWHRLDGYVSFVQGHSDTAGAVLAGAEWLAKWKALGAEVQTERYRLLQLTKDRELEEVLKGLAAARRELARMTLSPPANMDPDQVRRRREAARQEVEELESTLAQRSSQFAELRRVGRAELGQIAGAMPEGGVLLDYAHFQDFNFKAKGKQKQWGPWRYVVFITPAGEVPESVMVDLGLAEPIDDAIGALRKAVAEVEAGQRPESDKQIREKLMAVRKLVVDPALPHIREKEHWIICPDGQISLIPFACLPITDGKYLIEIKKISYLGAGREAVAYAGPPAKPEDAAKPLLVGDPDFDLTPDLQQAELQRMALEETALAMRGVGGSRDLRPVLFPPLPATGVEIERAAGLVGGTKLVRRRALEGAVKRTSRPEVLYLATHGFFLPDQERSKDDSMMSAMAFTNRASGPGSDPLGAGMGMAGPTIENPLLRCGLALAGANRREEAAGNEGIDDGILTGMEVAGLDLWGTQLVVLSACQTGLGDINQGEGVMGLRRAFLLAGARRVLATLWMVPDQQTQELMSDFITRWQAGTAGVDALREAQMAMIARLRKEHGHAHPFFWAAFTMTGDWR